MLTDKFNKFFRLNFGCKQVPSKLQANRFLTVQEEQEPRARVCLLMGYEEEEIMVWYSQVNNNNPLPHF